MLAVIKPLCRNLLTFHGDYIKIPSKQRRWCCGQTWDNGKSWNIRLSQNWSRNLEITGSGFANGTQTRLEAAFDQNKELLIHLWFYHAYLTIDCHNYIYVDELMLRMVKLWSYPVDWSEEITELVSGWGFRFNADFVIGAWLQLCMLRISFKWKIKQRYTRS